MGKKSEMLKIKKRLKKKKEEEEEEDEDSQRKWGIEKWEKKKRG